MSAYQILAIIILNTWYYSQILYLSKLNLIDFSEGFNGVLYVLMMTYLLASGNITLYMSITLVKSLYDGGITVVSYEAEGHVRRGLIRKLLGDLICFLCLFIYVLGGLNAGW